MRDRLIFNLPNKSAFGKEHNHARRPLDWPSILARLYPGTNPFVRMHGEHLCLRRESLVYGRGGYLVRGFQRAGDRDGMDWQRHPDPEFGLIPSLAFRWFHPGWDLLHPRTGVQSHILE